MVSPDKIRFVVDLLEKIILIAAIVKREYNISLLLVIVGLITAKIYADVVDLKRKESGRIR
jgi:hypothetical protein